jgi:peptidoglycan hydrolase-like protein with peptidoglycan-binding domain
LPLWLTGKKFLSVAATLLLLGATSAATTKKKSPDAPRHKGHPGSTHASSHKSEVVHHSSVKGTTKAKSHKRGHKTARNHGQQNIDSARAREIQTALIRANYMQGEPTGKWDQSTKDAMARYQGDNGWQTKTLPDSRALIKLGLGPSHDHLLNPDTAMTTRAESVGGGQKETEFSVPTAQRFAEPASTPVAAQPPGAAGTAQTSVAPVMRHSSGTAGSQTENLVPATPQ